MITPNESHETFETVWPDFQEYVAMTQAERYAYALAVLNHDRALIGAPPLDHIPTDEELARSRAAREQAYLKKHNSWRARLNRFFDRVLGASY